MLWILYASVLGFAVAAIFAGWLKLPRNIYLLIYIPLVAALFTLFIISNKINVTEVLLHNWYWGLIGAVIAGVFVFKNVFSQPSSKGSTGLELLAGFGFAGSASLRFVAESTPLFRDPQLLLLYQRKSRYKK